MSPGRTDRRGTAALLSVRIWLWRSRHGLRLAVATLALLAVTRALAPAPPDTTAVVVAARPVPAGTELDRGDLRVEHLPGAVPERTTAEPGALLGRTALVDLPTGLPVVEPVLEGERFGIDPPDGTVVVPLALTDGALAGMLRPGDRVDVVTTQSDDGGVESTAVLAERALVVDVRPAEGAVAGGVLAPAGDAGPPVVSVAVPAVEGRRLAGTSGWSVLGAVLVP
jgi:Flp pilus assembly protein CpaB